MPIGKKSASVRFEIDRASGRSFYEQVHDQFINMLHFGILTPGSRLPAVRQLASSAGVNLKTAFKIYRGLAREGLVEIRPQSGAFVRSGRGRAEHAYRGNVADFLDRTLEQAERLHLTPRRLVHLLSLEGALIAGASVTCAVLECNREQTRLFAAELERKLGVRAIPVELFSSSPPPGADLLLREADLLVTTDFHWEEGLRVAQRYRKKILRLRLDPGFFKMIVTAARKGPFAMILTDTAIQERFQASMAPYLKPAELDRVRLVHAGDRAGLAETNRRGGRVYVSPLCEAEVAPALSPKLEIVRHDDMIAADSLRELAEDLTFYPLAPSRPGRS